MKWPDYLVEDEETATSPQKPFTISLVLEAPGGYLRGCNWKVIPTGGSNIDPVSFWMPLLVNLNMFLTTHAEKQGVSLRNVRPDVPGS